MKSSRMKMSVISIAAGVIILLGILFVYINYLSSSKIMLKNSSGNITVTYVKAPQQYSSASSLAYLLTQQEIINQSEEIIYGKAVEFKDIEINFNGEKEYNTLITIDVNDVYKGTLGKGDKITVLAPCLLASSSIMVEDTSIISQLRQGDYAFFLLHKYTNTGYEERNGTKFFYSDIAQYGFGDGERFSLIKKGDSFIYDKSTFTSIPITPTFKDIQLFIQDRVSNK